VSSLSESTGYLLKFQVVLALLFLGHEVQDVLQMGDSGKNFFPVFLIVPLHVAREKVAVITMISWFPTDHWDSKTKKTFSYLRTTASVLHHKQSTLHAVPIIYLYLQVSRQSMRSRLLLQTL
jgi:hypothetical protein